MRRRGRLVLWGARRGDALLGYRPGMWMAEHGHPSPRARVHTWDRCRDGAWLVMPWR